MIGLAGITALFVIAVTLFCLWAILAFTVWYLEEHSPKTNRGEAE